MLGGNSLVGQVAAGTVVGAIGKEIGKALFMGGTYSLDVAVKDAFGTLGGGGTGIGGLPGAAIGAVSSLLIGELAKELHLTGFAGGLVTTVGTAVTTQLITNAYGVATGATLPNPVLGGDPIPYTMLTGFDPTSIATNIGGAIGGYLGSTLAAHVMVPHYAEGAIGESVGSSVGGFARRRRITLGRSRAQGKRRRQANNTQRGAALYWPQSGNGPGWHRARAPLAAVPVAPVDVRRGMQANNVQRGDAKE
jgi:hypothetical protein